jgi:alpha-tubulin suppressor-like RCC1 family protein
VQVGVDGWVMVGSGADHSCGIRKDQTLWCWGNNVLGDVGNANPESDAPTQLGMDTNWMFANAADSTSCTLKFGGTMLCFGEDTAGQLGDGSPTPEREHPVPVFIVPA